VIGTSPSAPLTETAPAKVNLILHVLGRRADGYHELESLVAFADEGDRLTLTPQDRLRLTVSGTHAKTAGADADNLVLKAAQALSARAENLKLGDFALEKNLPVAAGLGGGSSDAAAALRLLARTNGMAPDDIKLYKAARAVGADVPVCLDPRARIMRGIGHDLSPTIALPALPAVLANPGVALSTRDVFAALTVKQRQPSIGEVPRDAAALRGWLAQQGNDLETPARSLQPVIGSVLAALSHWGAELSRMSGSGATCFGIFATPDAARAAALAVTRAQPDWWVRATMLR
jgi:4-diphosphocytidyl-2-C-methyl-D-erythritol kinase